MVGRGNKHGVALAIGLLLALGGASGCASAPAPTPTVGAAEAEGTAGSPSSEPTPDGPSPAVGSDATRAAIGSTAAAGATPVLATVTTFSPEDVPFRGSAEPAVVVQVFSDFECPYCGLARSHVERLLTDFPTARVEFRHFPLSMHEHAGLAAQAAVEAYAQGGNPAFWCYHDALFDHQRELSRARILSFASGCGVDRQALDQALQDGRHAARVERDRAEGERLGVQGTPSFTVNGELLAGADYPDLEEAVDNVLYR